MTTLLIAERDNLFLEDYGRLKPSLVMWGNEVLSHVKTYLLAGEGLTQGPRIKEDKSILGKAFYRGVVDIGKFQPQDSKNTKILAEIWDKIGVRIVLQDLGRAQRVFDKIQNNSSWKSHKTKDLRSTIFSQPESFSYASFHVVVHPKPTSAYKSEERELLTCEIQIRTTLQHAYAEVSHDLIYKGPNLHDVEVRHMMARSQALLEVVDEHFVNIYKMTADLSRTSPQYVHDLVDLYRKYNPDFKDDQVNYQVADRYLSALKQVPIDKLTDFLEKREPEIRTGLKYNADVFLFRQPIVLLMAYYATRYPDYFQEHGDISNEDYKSILSGFNVGESIS